MKGMVYNMKTKEFIETIVDDGLYINETEGTIYVDDRFGVSIAYISKREYGVMSTDTNKFRELPQYRREFLTDIVYEYALTPIKDRETEEKFVLKFPYPITDLQRPKSQHYITRNDGELSLDSSGESFVMECQDFHFTDKDIESYEGADRALIDSCEKIKVIK